MTVSEISKLSFEGGVEFVVFMIDPVAERHVITIAVAPLLARLRARLSFFQRQLIERHTLPCAFGDGCLASTELSIHASRLEHPLYFLWSFELLSPED